MPQDQLTKEKLRATCAEALLEAMTIAAHKIQGKYDLLMRQYNELINNPPCEDYPETYDFWSEMIARHTSERAGLDK